MAIYDQGSFGYGSGQCSSMFSKNIYLQKAYNAISFPQPMRINRVAFKVGAYYGYQAPSYTPVNVSGRFIGVYCIWNSAGVVIATSSPVSSDANTSHSNSVNRADIWASFPNVKLEANTTYYVGWCATSSSGRSGIAWTSGQEGKHSRYVTSSNYSVGNISPGSDQNMFPVANTNGTFTDKHITFLFKIDAEPANTGVKLYANNRWNPRHGIYCYGGGWREQYLYYFNGHSWVDVTS